ncbi:hypothetical protein [Gracilibacillus salinarum]|uniref:Uncharacterized protein n=1 Tax=Gracilibacillus salinarum TaxID=2932255 RepID=A0ABY4GMX2_9BACI|nr:hypothetical protein [Gracilibacillus salinarum]UOQ85551.1 hypothetical protein MUN87_01205 [Gracilibacillus salinarum]
MIPLPGNVSHTEGFDTEATADTAHAEENITTARASRVEGGSAARLRNPAPNLASGWGSHADIGIWR